ncbi:hypothetical protein E3N88_06114 [Mikania micrantha]|uniref:Small ribosomal subunit protein uS15c n=1 Tax=Mikania micrantha TaxID=192012 RepID=A0A5N6PMW4_9ASTR|nr:hypothetical protein E3N88_06114 [Mikania micrantha]
MVATAIFLHFRPHRHRGCILQNIRLYSSSSSNSDDDRQNRISPSHSQAQFSLNDVKSSLKQPTPSPQYTRRPSFDVSNYGNRENPTQKVVNYDEISKSLSNYHRPSSVKPPQPTPSISFHELYKRNLMPKADTGSGSENGDKPNQDYLKAIRMSLKSSTPQPQPRDAHGRSSDLGLNLKLKTKSLNDSMQESTEETKIEFVRAYSYGHMGEMLRKLRPGNKNFKFSLEELNERMQKFREMKVIEEEKQTQKTGGFEFGGLRESLYKIKIKQDDEKTKKNKGTKFSIFDSIGERSSPKEALVEKYFHPDHMSSAEKQKLELKNVREKFKISESDCGSARVQVAQLTTKIKHLATVLHKKDKHSRKGLQAMVQKRKKLLKYLRRTDWDSYCFCLSELGLRDSADYKA